MKSLRMSALMLALVSFSICSIPAHAQQKVDPDHFDQPRAASIHARGSGKQSPHNAAAAQDRANTKLAIAHSHKAYRRQYVRQIHGSKRHLGRLAGSGMLSVE